MLLGFNRSSKNVQKSIRSGLKFLSLMPFICGNIAAASTSSGFSAGDVAGNPQDNPSVRFLKEHFGVSYNSFFAGPGPGMALGYPPGLAGTPGDTGLNFLNIVSVKYKLGNGYAVDVQFRNQMVITNMAEFRFQGQRFGFSGRIVGGDEWSIDGAFNTDIPISPIMGQLATQRTLLLSPGFFGSFNWEPKGSRWSVFALLAPRMWIYSDPNAVAVQDTFSGGTMNKPQYDLFINPSINYKISESVGWRLGTTIDFLKNVGWNSLQRTFMPFETGITWDISKEFGIYTYFQTSTPMDDNIRAMQLGTSSPPGWLSTASLNVWMYGTLF
jgi:hypothetical protein